eukprot:15343685-Ditylum_brightwellii.AAC.1
MPTVVAIKFDSPGIVTASADKAGRIFKSSLIWIAYYLDNTAAVGKLKAVFIRDPGQAWVEIFDETKDGCAAY